MLTTILLLILIAVLAIPILSQRNADKIKSAKETEALKAIAPGVYINSYQVDNPFVDDYDYVRVHEVKDGWVRYTYTREANPRHATMRSMKAKQFVGQYSPYPFD